MGSVIFKILYLMIYMCTLLEIGKEYYRPPLPINDLILRLPGATAVCLYMKQLE